MKKTIVIAGLAGLLLPCGFAAEAAKEPAKAEAKTEAKAEAKTEAKQTDSAKPAEEKGWFSDKLKVMKSRISRKMQSASVRPSAVAAVRGSETSVDAMEPDWKGGDSEKAANQSEKERNAITSAFEKIVAGKTDDGAADLKKFMSEYPDSPYRDTVKEALEKLGVNADCDMGAAAKDEVKPADEKAK